MVHNSIRLIGFMALAVFFVLFFIPTGMAASTGELAASRLYIDGKPAEYKKLKVKNRIENMIALRTVMTELNMKLEWVTKNKEWILSNSSQRIQMKLDSATVTVNSKQQKIAAPAIKDNGTIYVPLRFIIVSSGGELHNYRGGGIDVYWALSPNQIVLARALVLNEVDEVKHRLKDWRDATIPLGVDGTMPYAFAGKSIGMVKLLLDSGFPVNYQEYDYDNILFFGLRSTLLHSAASYGNPDVVRYLLDHGADPHLTTANDGWTALQSATWSRESVGDEIFVITGNDATVEDYDEIIALLKERMNLGLSERSSPHYSIIASRNN